MTDWTKIENDPPAVLRALAEGKKVRHSSWPDHEFVHLSPVGCIVDEVDIPYGGCKWSGAWFIEPLRDIVTDPQVGDEFLWYDDRAKVVSLADGFVFFHDGKDPSGRTLERWASEFSSGCFKRIEDKQ